MKQSKVCRYNMIENLGTKSDLAKFLTNKAFFHLYEYVLTRCRLKNICYSTISLQGGMTANGERLFIGRAFHENHTVCGKVHPSHNGIYIAYGGEEIKYHNYEVLVSASN